MENEIFEEMACEDLGEELREEGLAAENLRLKGQLACAKAGVPGEIAGDIMAAALAGVSGGSGVSGEELEAAVKAVYERISGAVGKAAVSGGISTGVRSEKGGVSNEALRRAFGLR